MTRNTLIVYFLFLNFEMTLLYCIPRILINSLLAFSTIKNTLILYLVTLIINVKRLNTAVIKYPYCDYKRYSSLIINVYLYKTNGNHIIIKKQNKSKIIKITMNEMVLSLIFITLSVIVHLEN